MQLPSAANRYVAAAGIPIRARSPCRIGTAVSARQSPATPLPPQDTSTRIFSRPHFLRGRRARSRANPNAPARSDATGTSDQQPHPHRHQGRRPHQVEVDPAPAQHADADPVVDQRRATAAVVASMARLWTATAARAWPSGPAGRRGGGRGRRRRRAVPGAGSASGRRRAPSPSGTTRRRGRPGRWSCRSGPGGGGRRARARRPSRSGARPASAADQRRVEHGAEGHAPPARREHGQRVAERDRQQRQQHHAPAAAVQAERHREQPAHGRVEAVEDAEPGQGQPGPEPARRAQPRLTGSSRSPTSSRRPRAGPGAAGGPAASRGRSSRRTRSRRPASTSSLTIQPSRPSW